jgi:hypothetical protein
MYLWIHWGGGSQPEHHTIKNNTEPFLQASEDICLQVNVSKASSLALFISVTNHTNCTGGCYKLQQFSFLHRFLCHKWSYEWICCVWSTECTYRSAGAGPPLLTPCFCRGRVATADTMFLQCISLTLSPIISVLLAPCILVLSLRQTLVHFSSYGFLTYILFCVIIPRFPSFIDLVQIVACWYDVIWYDMSLFVRNHVLFKSVSLCLCLHTFQKSLNVILVHLQSHITSLFATNVLRVAEFFLKASQCWDS